jgi:2-polyprenyl-3-methyl-5-hydroxy-6-metoxy-1,4-benzoquinol methylase
VGCGLGADAEYLASLGFDTVGFDISETAIRLARERFPGSAVRYVSADLLIFRSNGYMVLTSSPR